MQFFIWRFCYFFFDIVNVNSIQQDYIINKEEIESFAILRLLLSITKLLFNRDKKEV